MESIPTSSHLRLQRFRLRPPQLCHFPLQVSPVRRRHSSPISSMTTTTAKTWMSRQIPTQRSPRLPKTIVTKSSLSLPHPLQSYHCLTRPLKLPLPSEVRSRLPTQQRLIRYLPNRAVKHPHLSARAVLSRVVRLFQAAPPQYPLLSSHPGSRSPRRMPCHVGETSFGEVEKDNGVEQCPFVYSHNQPDRSRH